MSDYHDDEYVDLDSSDWGDTSDDADGQSYESYGYEPPENDYDDNDDCTEHVIDPCDPCKGCKSCETIDDYRKSPSPAFLEWKRQERLEIVKHDSTNGRNKEIIRWVYNSNCSKEFKDDKGFFVSSGSLIKLKTGQYVDIVDWLEKEGIKNDRYICGYVIVKHDKSSTYKDKLSFFKIEKEMSAQAEGYQSFLKNNDGDYKHFKITEEGLTYIPYEEALKLDYSTERQKSILNWLIESKYALRKNHLKGFYVEQGVLVTLKSGEKIDILDWLIREGLLKLKKVSGYKIKHLKEKDHYKEKVQFIRIE